MCSLAPGRSGFCFYFVIAAAAAFALLIRARLSGTVSHIKNWRAGVVWALQSLLAAVVLVLLWQPAITVAELKPQQNIIAVVVDDSRSMSIADDGTPREDQAVKALQNGVLSDLQKSYQTRIYSLDSRATRSAASPNCTRRLP